MIWSDPIVDEVRRAHDAYAARFNYDLKAICRDLKEQEKRSGRKIVSYAKDSATSKRAKLSTMSAASDNMQVQDLPKVQE